MGVNFSDSHPSLLHTHTHNDATIDFIATTESRFATWPRYPEVCLSYTANETQ